MNARPLLVSVLASFLFSPALFGGDSLREIVAKVEPSVVTLEVFGGKLGSGFLIDEKGTLVTNYHVIEGAEKIVAIFADKRKVHVAGFIAYSQEKDLAILRLAESEFEFKPLSVAKSDPAKGERTIAIGATHGFSGTITEGIVSSVRLGSEVRTIYRGYAELGYSDDAQWIQTSAKISHGNSGGPLLNERGEVIGVNTWAIVHSGEALNFAISAHHLRKFAATELEKVAPLDRLPPPRPEKPVAAERVPDGKGRPLTPAERERLAIRLDTLKRLYQQRIVLFRQREIVQTEIIGLKRDFTRASTEKNQLLAAVQSMAQASGSLQGQATAIQQRLLVEPDLATRNRLQEQLNSIAVQVQANGQQAQALAAQAAQVNAECTSLGSQLQAADEKFRRLYVEADSLRKEWLGLMDPFGRLAAGEHETAIAILTEWIVLDTGFWLAYLARGYAYLTLGEPEKALSDFETASRLDSSVSPVTLAASGKAVGVMGKYRSSLAKFGEAIKRDKSYALAYLHRGEVLAMYGEDRRAIEDFQVVLQLEPQNVEALRSLAWLLATCPKSSYRNGAKAVDFATKASELTRGGDWWCELALAAAHAENGSFVEAERIARRAASIAPAEQAELCLGVAKAFAAETPLRVETRFADSPAPRDVEPAAPAASAAGEAKKRLHLARLLLNAGKTGIAAERFREIVKEFPGSAEASECEKLLAEIEAETE